MRPDNFNLQTVVQRDSRIFLRIDRDWVYYDLNEKPLGEGAMGIVYLGRSCSTNKKFAVKRVVDHYADIPSIRERARQEASLLFRHRNLVEMVGYCEVNPDCGPIFIVSHLVQGTTIDKYISTFLRGRQNEMKKICQMMYPVFSALEYLHSKNIVHMDIKPSNIMVENGSNVRLMDLGIATTDSAMQFKGTGVIGTPAYAAPEQIFDENQSNAPINFTTDIYELGITLYELLTGSNPFSATSRDETLVRQKSMTLPSSPRITKPVLNVLRKATAKSQGNRYNTVNEFKTALLEAVDKKGTDTTLKILIGIAITIVTIFIIGLVAL